jgi:hypothetical protein
MGENSGKENLRRQKTRWLIKRFSVVLASALVLFTLGSLCAQDLFHSTRLDTTKMRLKTVRMGIEEFKKETLRFPTSLSEIEEYGKKNPEATFLHSLGKEFLSDPEGNSQEFTELNGKGGWYYNKDTGEIRVNLNKPLMNYLNTFFGKERNEVPSDW